MSVSIIRQGDDAAAFDVAYQLKKLTRSARQAEEESRRRKQEKADQSRRRGKEDDLPELTGKTDPARVPAANQPEEETVALEYLLVSHREAVPPIGSPPRDKGEARRIAGHLAALARQENADFADLATEYSDSPDYTIPLLLRDPKTATALLPCFRLRTGQVSDPIDTSKGFMVFRRIPLDLIEVRHILIAYEGAQGSTQTRTREEARELAERILSDARKGEDFARLAREYSDSTSAKDGGLIGEIARGTTVPAFDHAAFSLDVNEISNVTLSPAGYQIIKRIK